MRIDAKQIIAVFDVTKGCSGVASAAESYGKNGRTVFSVTGDARSMLVVDCPQRRCVCFSNASTRLIKRQLENEGFIFI